MVFNYVTTESYPLSFESSLPKIFEFIDLVYHLSSLIFCSHLKGDSNIHLPFLDSVPRGIFLISKMKSLVLRSKILGLRFLMQVDRVHFIYSRLDMVKVSLCLYLIEPFWLDLVSRKLKS